MKRINAFATVQDPEGNDTLYAARVPSIPMTSLEHRFAAVSVRSAPSSVIQCKMTVGAVDDPTEIEAEKLARQVMEIEDPQNASSGMVNRSAARNDFDGTEDVSDVVHQAIHAGSPQMLDNETRAFMERRFQYDFSRVRIHTGETASRSANALKAHAYTINDNVVFATGKYTPGTREGNHLIAHELTHVIQQGGAVPLPPLTSSPDTDESER